ncbi:mu-type opioid receptor-like [Patiria miniata]|uniref:G-protein coupled receptors family 1 profile domain-containing protein n=1 Tax=Patiria miniata TaxID=46514 RepID=A0A914A720_PATMI|nr:mu-type opioid receptor-like [Patiria miniata]
MDGFDLEDVCVGRVDLDFRNVTEISLLRSSVENWVTLIGIPLVLLLGVPSNLSFLFTLYRVPTMRTTTNLHLANLAVSDFIYLSVVAILNVRGYLTTPVSGTALARSWVECCAIILFIDIPYFASNTIVTLVAFERYYAICHPLKQNASGPRRHLGLIIAGWIVSIAFAFSVVLRYSKLTVICVLWPDTEEFKSLSQVVTFCSSGEPWANLYSQGLYSVIWLGGLLTNSFLYSRIIHRLSQRNLGQTSVNQAIRRSVARMLIVNSAVFFLCQAPYTIVFNLLNLISAAKGNPVTDPRQVTELWPLIILMGLVNSAVNPIIYGLANSRYRQAFLQAFGCTMATQRRREIKTISTASSNVPSKDNRADMKDKNASFSMHGIDNPVSLEDEAPRSDLMKENQF